MQQSLQTALDRSEYPAGNWISIGHPAVAELSSMLGFDFVLIDMEHTSIDLALVEDLVRAVDAPENSTDAIVRIPEIDSTIIKRVLDIGVGGIMAPMVETAEQARLIVDATRYPPDGTRGIASGRATQYGLHFEEYVQNANGSILTILQIENKAGVRNVDEIASVDGVNALFVGPADLSANLDVFSQWDSDELNDTINQIISAGHDSEIPVGTLTVTDEEIRPRIEQGFDFLIVGMDVSYFSRGAQSALAVYDESVAEITDT